MGLRHRWVLDSPTAPAYSRLESACHSPFGCCAASRIISPLLYAQDDLPCSEMDRRNRSILVLPRHSYSRKGKNSTRWPLVYRRQSPECARGFTDRRLGCTTQNHDDREGYTR